MEQTGYDVRKVSDGRTHFVLVWRKFCLWALSGINRPTLLFIVYILCICNFLYFVTSLCAFCANYSPPQIRNTCAPKQGRWSFHKNEFYTPLLFLMYDVYVTTVSSLIKVILVFWKVLRLFPKFKICFKKPSHNRRLSPKQKIIRI
jgi:hypothetical protein